MGSEDGEGRMVMKRKITLLNAVSLIVGSIIGSGIFVSPGGVLNSVDSGGTALIIWTLCGLICTIGAICFSELGTMLPSSGGEYTYILHAFGSLPAFLTLWMNVLVIRPAAQAVVAIAFAEYALAPIFQTCKPPRRAVELLAASSICLLLFINCYSARLAMRIQTLFTSGKLLALGAIILAGMYQLVIGNADAENFVITKGEEGVGNIAMALYAGTFAFGGWNYANFIIEELKDPYKNLPRSIWIGLPLVSIIYVLANIAYLSVLSVTEIKASSAVAVLFGQRVLGPLQYSVPFFVALSTFGSLNGILFTSGRLFLCGAKEGHLPMIMSYINVKSRTPIPALLMTGLFSLFLIGLDILFLINYLMFVLWVSIGAATAALLWLRRTKPNLPRPIKVHLALPIVFLACCIFLIVVPIYTNYQSSGLATLMTLCGIPVYMVGVMWKNKPKFALNAYYALETKLQMILLVVPRDENDDQPLLDPRAEDKCDN